MRKQEISQEQLSELEAFEKQVTDKATYCRVQCVLLRAKQWSADQIAKATGYGRRHVERIQGAYFKEGLNAFERKKREKGGNQRLLPSQEVALFESLEAEASEGDLVTVSRIHEKFEEVTGKPCSRSGVYHLIHRNGWSKKQPRPRHPKGCEEAKTLFKKPT